jgi:hypothetical protein
MHNLHLIKVKANSGEEACQIAENQIIDFGNENNWRAFCGAISEDNEVYNSGDGRYQPKDTDINTIEEINQCVNNWMKSTWYSKTAEEKFERGETNLNEWDSHELWSLSKWAIQLSESHSYRDRPFDCMKGDTFFSYKYDECGLTDCTWSGNDEDKIWFVFCDMHS